MFKKEKRIIELLLGFLTASIICGVGLDQVFLSKSHSDFFIFHALQLLTYYLFFQSDKEYEFSSNHFYKFMFVRHPMERLVSCYYDKMMVNPHKSLRAFRRAVKMRARKIMARSRSQLSSSEASDSKEMFRKRRKKRSVTSSKNEDPNGNI